MELLRFEELTMAELEGNLTPEEERELEAACVADPQLRRMRDHDLQLVSLLKQRGPTFAPPDFAPTIMDLLTEEDTDEYGEVVEAPAPRVAAERESRPWWMQFLGLPAVRWGFGLALPLIFAFMLVELFRQPGADTSDGGFRAAQPKIARGAKRTSGGAPIEIAEAPKNAERAVESQMNAPAETATPAPRIEKPSSEVAQASSDVAKSKASSTAKAPTASPIPAEKTPAPREIASANVTPAPSAAEIATPAARAEQKPADTAPAVPPAATPAPKPPAAKAVAQRPTGPAKPPIQDENFNNRVWSESAQRQHEVASARTPEPRPQAPPKVDVSSFAPTSAPGIMPTNTATPAPGMPGVIPVTERTIAALPSPTPMKSAPPNAAEILRSRLQQAETARAAAATPTPAPASPAAGPASLQILIATAPPAGSPSPRPGTPPPIGNGTARGFQDGAGAETPATAAGKLSRRQIEIMMARRGTILRRTADSRDPAVTHLVWRVTARDLSIFLRELEHSGVAKTASEKEKPGATRYFFDRGGEPAPEPTGRANPPSRTMEIEMTLRDIK